MKRGDLILQEGLRETWASQPTFYIGVALSKNSIYWITCPMSNRSRGWTPWVQPILLDRFTNDSEFFKKLRIKVIPS